MCQQILSELLNYVECLRQAGYKNQAKAAGLLASKFMLDLDSTSISSIKAKDACIGMMISGVGKRSTFGFPGNYGEIKYIHTEDKSVVISVYAPQLEDNFELVIGKNERLRVLSTIKPFQRKALLIKAKTLLTALSDRLEKHELGPMLSRLNYEFKID